MADINVISSLLAGRSVPFFRTAALIAPPGVVTPALDFTVNQGYVVVITNYTFTAGFGAGLNIFLNDQRLLVNSQVQFFGAGVEIWLAPRARFRTETNNTGVGAIAIAHSVSGLEIPKDIFSPERIAQLTT